MIRVDRLKEPLKPSVATGRSPNTDLGDRFAGRRAGRADRRDGRLGRAHPVASRSSPSRTPPRAISSGVPNRSEARFRMSSPAGSSRTRSRSSRELPGDVGRPLAPEQPQRALDRLAVKARAGELTQRRCAPADGDRLGRLAAHRAPPSLAPPRPAPPRAPPPTADPSAGSARPGRPTRSRTISTSGCDQARCRRRARKIHRRHRRRRARPDGARPSVRAAPRNARRASSSPDSTATVMPQSRAIASTSA